MCFTDVAGEFLRVGITSLGLHTWQSVIGASVAHAEQNPLLVCIFPVQKSSVIHLSFSDVELSVVIVKDMYFPTGRSILT
jgi:hypothetical protein